MKCSRQSLALASVAASLLLLVLWYPVLPQRSAVLPLSVLPVAHAVSVSEPSYVSNEPVRTEGRQFSSTEEISLGERRQYNTKYEIPWGGVLPIPRTKTKVWIDIGTNINPIVPPSSDVYMILVDPIPNLVMNNEKAFPNPKDVAVVWSAISNRTGTATFNIYNTDGKSSSLASAVSMASSNVIEVPVHTLEELIDTIPKEFEIELLKTDMQGFDLVGLKSARGSLKRVKIITSEFEVEKAAKEYVGVDNSMTAAAHHFKSLGFSKIACGKLDCQYRNVDICKSSPSSCTVWGHKQRICRQYTVIEDKNLAKCKQHSVTSFRARGDTCTMCKPFV